MYRRVSRLRPTSGRLASARRRVPAPKVVLLDRPRQRVDSGAAPNARTPIRQSFENGPEIHSNKPGKPTRFCSNRLAAEKYAEQGGRLGSEFRKTHRDSRDLMRQELPRRPV